MPITLRPLLLAFGTVSAIFLTGTTCPAVTKTDPEATALVNRFYDNLKGLTVMDNAAFGQQFTTWKGINANGTPWQGTVNRSDIKTVTGYHPGVSGWNFEIYLSSSNTDRTSMRQRIIADFVNGMIITFHWEMRNPNTGGDSKDRAGVAATPTLLAQAVTTGTAANTKLKSDLDQLATLLGQLSYNGELVPVIFRPYHEMNGGWFWWGQGNVNEFKALWNFTLAHLRDTKNKHQLLYCYSPSGNNFTSKTEYLTYWPGNNSVDICGVDQYLKDTDPISKWNDAMIYTFQVASYREMPAAFTEIGRSQGLTGTTNNTWWTSRMLAAFNDPVRPLWTKCAYIMTWTNQSTSSYFVPYHAGHVQTPDFKNFVADPHVLLQPELTVYQ